MKASVPMGAAYVCPYCGHEIENKVGPVDNTRRTIYQGDKSSKCKTCTNRDTGWCKGCEHNFPGLDQFDFYQATTESEAEDV